MPTRYVQLKSFSPEVLRESHDVRYRLQNTNGLSLGHAQFAWRDNGKPELHTVRLRLCV